MMDMEISRAVVNVAALRGRTNLQANECPRGRSPTLPLLRNVRPLCCVLGTFLVAPLHPGHCCCALGWLAVASVPLQVRALVALQAHLWEWMRCAPESGGACCVSLSASVRRSCFVLCAVPRKHVCASVSLAWCVVALAWCVDRIPSRRTRLSVCGLMSLAAHLLVP